MPHIHSSPIEDRIQHLSIATMHVANILSQNVQTYPQKLSTVIVTDVKKIKNIHIYITLL